MSDTLQLNLKVNAETGQLEVLGQKLDAVGSKSRGLSGEASSLFKSFLPFATAGGVVAFFTNAVKAAEEENEALRTLKFTLESNGVSWEKNGQQVQQWANALQQTTRFSDGEALQSLNRLTRATGDVARAQSAATIAMNLSVATGKTLSETTDLINGLITKQSRAVMLAHKEYGTYAGAANDAQSVLDSLANSTKNAALTEEGLTKNINLSKNAFEEFSQQIGSTLMPAVNLIVGGFTGLLRIVDTVASGVALQMAAMFHAIDGVAQAAFALLHGRFGEAKNIAKQALDNIASDVKTTAADVVNTWSGATQEQTAIVQAGAQQRVTITARETDEEKRLKQEQTQKIAQFEAEIAQNLASLERDSFAKKSQLLNLEMTQRKQKITREVLDEKAKQKLLAELDNEQLKRTAALQKAETQMKLATALDTADIALQTLSIINSLGDKHNAAELNRARAILAFERAIAIARAISAAMAAPPGVSAALAAAQVALVVAQSVQQFQALENAQKAFKQGQTQIAVSTPMLNGNTLTEISGGGGAFVGGGGGGNNNTGSSGGGGINIVIGDIIINGYADPDIIAKHVGEKILERIKGMGEIAFTGVV